MCQMCEASISQGICSPARSFVSSTSPKGKIPYSPRFSLSASSDSTANEVLKGLFLFPDFVEEPKKPSKSVRFDSTIRVVLIPSRQEYVQEKLSSRVWYNRKELSRIGKEGLISASLGHFYDDRKQNEDDEEYGDTSHIYPLQYVESTEGEVTFL